MSGTTETVYKIRNRSTGEWSKYGASGQWTSSLLESSTAYTPGGAKAQITKVQRYVTRFTNHPAYGHEVKELQKWLDEAELVKVVIVATVIAREP